MDAAERLPLLVVAHAVEVEAGRPPHQEPAPLGGARSGFREQPVHVDEPRIDEDRRARRKLDRGPLEPERVLDHDLGLLGRIAPARNPPKDVAAAKAAVAADERGLPLAETGDPLAQDERARRRGPVDVQLELHRDVVAGQPLAAAEVPAEVHRPVEEADPERRGDHGQDEPDRDRIEHLRAEGPGGEVDPASEGEDPAAAVGEHGVSPRA